MKTIITCLFVSAGLLASAANALASDEMAKKYNCLACHATDKKLIGPSYKDVAAKYKGDAGAEPEREADRPDADVKALVKWVLSTK